MAYKQKLVMLMTVLMNVDLDTVDAIRCFKCSQFPSPELCTEIVDCGADEYCHTEQAVTPGGQIIYNSGCVQKSQCGGVFGRRNMVKKAGTDIVTCRQCCHGDFCNNEGCGIKAVSRDQRGPYCYNCDAMLDPAGCNQVSVCNINEQCLLDTKSEFLGLPQNVYKSMCALTSQCQALTAIPTTGPCPPTCCNSDFCNDNCNASAQVVMSTNPVVMTTVMVNVQTTQLQNHVTGAGSCDLSDGYTVLDTHSSAHLCIRVYDHDRLTWPDAEQKCKSEGGRLIVLDTTDKSHPLRNYLEANYRSGNFWIGASDTNLNNVFFWVNGQPMDLRQDDWDAGQPNHHDAGKDQNCVRMLPGHFHHLWHDQYCYDHNGYICERV